MGLAVSVLAVFVLAVLVLACFVLSNPPAPAPKDIPLFLALAPASSST